VLKRYERNGQVKYSPRPLMGAGVAASNAYQG
jgi:hypothetical protein